MSMLKKIMTTIGLTGMVLLSGCSLLGEVNNTLEYATTTTEYIDTANNFANEVTELANDAVANEEARQQLEEELTAMKAKIQEFNETEAPAIAEDIHNQIVSYKYKARRWELIRILSQYRKRQARSCHIKRLRNINNH